MPLYEYECEACQKRFERIQKFSDPLADVCPNCGKGPVRKLLSSPAIQFKGSGFYITDYAKKSSSEASGKSSSGGESSSSASEAKPSSDSSKSDSKSSDASTKPADKKS
jgi:putative FmdB family regulatory protein